MLLGLLALLPGLHAEPVGGTDQRFGMGLHAGLGAGLSAKLYLTDKIGVSGSAGFWALLVRRQTLVVEVDAYTVRFDAGSLVATGGFGLVRQADTWWRGATSAGVRLSTSALWRWQDRPLEVGTEVGVELFNYDWSQGQFGELITATLVGRWYPGWGS